jgi:hypothetical protein
MNQQRPRAQKLSERATLLSREAAPVALLPMLRLLHPPYR